MVQRTDAAGPSKHWDWLTAFVTTRFHPVLGIVSPPRCGSTMVARSLWQHPAMRWYAHEPFDQWYHYGRTGASVSRAVERSLDKSRSPRCGEEHDETPSATGLVLKEMTFQLADQAPALFGATTLPLVLVVRDPAAAMASRARQRLLGKDDPIFPVYESGWEQLARMSEQLRENRIPYVVVDAATLSQEPETGLRALCGAIGLDFSPLMLTWPSLPPSILGSLGGAQDHWYDRVLASTGFEAMSNAARSNDLKLLKGGLAEHVDRATEVYQDLLADPQRVV